MIDPITPRPIAELNSDMGMVLLIGSSGYTTTPTRAEIGYRDDNGRLRTYDGETFTSGGDDATSFIEIPYDQKVALDLARGEPVLQSEDLINVLTTLRGIAFELADAIGPIRAVNQLRITLESHGAVNATHGPGEKLISTLNHILDHGNRSLEDAEYDIRKVRELIEASDAAALLRSAA